MTDRRDRHDRGIRGPLSLPNPLTGPAVRVPGRVSSADFFVKALTKSVQHVTKICPECLAGIDIGIEDVPSISFDWAGVEEIPLAVASDATATRPARIVLFRRPLERRADSRQDLLDLVHLTLAEQLAALTGYSLRDIGPELDE